MGFKMKKMNFGKGTGSVQGLPKKRSASDPVYENFARGVDEGEQNWSDHPDYNPDYKYDKYGNPIPTNIRIPNYNKDLLEYDKFADDYEGTPNHIYGTIDTFDQSGKKSTSQLRDGKFLERDDFQFRIDEAKSKYYKAEQKHGVGNVTRGDMTDYDFDILLNYGGGEDGTSSWVQERQVAAARGQLDNEPHIVGTDAMMYPNLKEGEVPKLRQMQKNMRNIYQNVMSDTDNADDSLRGYGRGKLDNISNRDAMKLAKDLIPSHSLTSTPTSSRPGEEPNLTDTQEEAEVQEVEQEMESEEFKELTSEPTVEIKNDEKLEEETSGEEKEEYVPQTQQKEYVPQSQQFKSDDIPQEPSILGSESSEDVDPVDDPPPPVDDPSGEPEYGTDEYYAKKKAERSKMLGLTKRPLNIHGRI